MCSPSQQSGIIVNKHWLAYALEKTGVQFTVPGEMHGEHTITDNAVLDYSKQNYPF